jgi:anti-sigma factor RsiW
MKLSEMTRVFGSGCRRFGALLSPFIDGELDAGPRAEVEAHLATCPRCRREHAEMVLAARAVSKLSLPAAAALPPVPAWLSEATGAAGAETRRRGSRWNAKLVPLAAAAAGVVVLLVGAVFWSRKAPERASWEVTRLEGAPRVNSRAVGKTSRLGVGDWVETNDSSRALIAVGRIGHVEVDVGTRARLVAAGPDEHRLELVRGRLDAAIIAPPKLFFIETPAATAVDYGCAYTLSVDEAGVSLLHVTAGWVSLAVAGGRESLVPAGAMCRAEPGKGPGTPFAEDASDTFREALDKLDFRLGGDPALDTVLDEARAKDALTLWHLLERMGGAARERVYSRLAALVPPPTGVTREGVLRLDPRMLSRWRERVDYASVGLDPATVPAATGSLQPTGATNAPRFAHTATRLSDGRVLVVGGLERDGVPLKTAEIYEPARGTFTDAGSMSSRRVGHTATLLRDGSVLIAGGSEESFYKGASASAEIYDPRAGAFVSIPGMGAARLAHRATLLPDGRVLITGGQDETGRKLESAEIYDPAARAFRAAGPMGTSRSDHTATLLPNGHVLIVGGSTGLSGEEPVASAEVYDPAANRFTPTGGMRIVRFKHSATLLPDGRVIVVGGSDVRMWGGRYDSAEIYDPASGTFHSTGRMSTSRYKIRDAVVLLRNGRLLVAGGGAHAEVYDPATGVFGRVQGGSSIPRYYSTATELENGEVLIVGGYLGVNRWLEADASAWIYRP